MPELTTKAIDPKGVLQKNTKTIVFLGACGLVILAAVFSAGGKKSSTQAASKNQPPQPMLQDNTDNNVADMKNPRWEPPRSSHSSGRAAFARARHSEVSQPPLHGR